MVNKQVYIKKKKSVKVKSLNEKIRNFKKF